MSNLSIKEDTNGVVTITMDKADYDTLITGFQKGADYVERHEAKIRELPFEKREPYLRIKDLRERIIRYARTRFFGEN